MSLDKKVSRTVYSARNTSVAFIGKTIAILMGYFARVVFTHTLSSDYVSVNGLMLDIFNVLALSELGVSVAISYALYGPIAVNDTEKQKSLMSLYKKFYYLVSAIIFTLGMCIFPFLNRIISDDIHVEYLSAIYLLYLADSCLSYFLAYKKTLIEAHQKNYIVTSVQTISFSVQNIAQILILLLSKNFIVYLLVRIACTLLNNIVCSLYASREYPYLNDKNVAPLSSEEKSSIFTNVKAMLVHKIGTVIVNNTDNILLSIIVGTLSVGSYSNYYLIIGSARQILNQAISGVTASVGNLSQTDDSARLKKVFLTTFFVNQWMYSLAAICLYQVLDLFVGVSFGNNYVFSKEITYVLCMVFYVKGMREACLVFRDSMGLSRYDWIKAIFEIIINLVASIILGKIFGVIGIFLGTIICTLTTSTWVEPFVLYRHKLKTGLINYYLRWILYTAVMTATLFGTDYICSFIGGNGWLTIIGKGLVAFVVTNVVFLAVYFKTDEFSQCIYRLKSILKKK